MFKNVKPKWHIGIIALAITIVFFIFVAAPLQLQFGMWGLAITELGILFIGLLPIFLFKWKLNDLIPLKKIKLKQLIAISLFFTATYTVVNTVTVVTAYFFPEIMQVGSEMNEFYQTVPFILAIIIMSIMPGICEEVLHRGLILHTLRNRKNDMVIMILMAVLFGAFHLDPYRFLPTAIIGFILTYIMIKTENFFLPVIYHTANNAITVALSYGADTSQTVSMPLESIGIFLVFSALSPFLFYIGVKLLSNEKPNKKSKYAVLALTLLLPILGIGVLSLSLVREPITDFSFTEEVNRETPPKIFYADIEKENVYDLYVSMSDKTITVITAVTVEHEDGEIVWEIKGGDLFANKPTNLRTGKYRIIFTFDTQSELMISVEVSFAIK